MTVCNVCTLNLRQANFQLIGDAELRARVNSNLVAVGVPALRARRRRAPPALGARRRARATRGSQAAAHKGLKGLKIAPFYGCQILRPSRVLGFENPDAPSSLERIIEACGGEAVDYPAKLKCCGFPIIQAREETALGELDPADRAGDGGRRRRDRDAVPALPPLARRVAVEAEGDDGARLRDADPAPLAADRRRRRAAASRS